MRLRFPSVFALTGLSFVLLGACTDKFADCDEDKTCLDAPTASGGDGDTGTSLASRSA